MRCKLLAKLSFWIVTPALMTAPASAAPGWGSTLLTIESVIPGDQSFTMVVSGNDNPVGCSSSGWMRLKFTNPGFASISAAILTAFAQGKKLKAYQVSCETDGSVLIYGVWIDR